MHATIMSTNATAAKIILCWRLRKIIPDNNRDPRPNSASVSRNLKTRDNVIMH